jgi:hypothetical protein
LVQHSNDAGGPVRRGFSDRSGGWFSDPSGRFKFRYWSDGKWTTRVLSTSRGEEFVDELEPHFADAPPSAAISRAPKKDDVVPVSRGRRPMGVSWRVLAILIGLAVCVSAGYLIVEWISTRAGDQESQVTDDASPLSGAAYAKDVCGILVRMDASAGPQASKLVQAARTFQATPTTQSAHRLADTLNAAEGVVAVYPAVLTSIRQRTPPIETGPDFVTALVTHLQAEQAADGRLVTGLRALDTSNATAFNADLQHTLDAAARDRDGLAASARKDPAFQRAPDSLRPLIDRFVGGSDHSCSNL